jgi:glycosyltransferase involved in cell wall biosynthesis
MAEPLVSIIIPVYNVEKYLVEGIESAIAQTWSNKEIIIVDDGSTDNSFNIIQKYSVYSNIKIIRQKNQGASAARNTGLAIAKGEYIQFLDADDLLSKNKIESQINQLLNFPEHIALCGTVHFEDGTEPTKQDVKHEWFSQGSNDPVDFLIKLYGGGYIGPEYGGMIQPNAWLTPKRLIIKAGPWNEMRNPDDDGEFFCRVMLSSKGIVYSADAVNYYRKFNTNNSLSGQKDRQASSNILKSTDLKASHLLSRTDNYNAKMALSRLYYENAFSFYPKYIDLALEAEKKGKSLTPNFPINPYNSGVTSILSKLIGWKKVRYLQYLKNKI